MIEEKIKIVADEDFPLNGLLTIPDKVDGAVDLEGIAEVNSGDIGSGDSATDGAQPQRRYPAVVLVQGSGSTDMNESVYGRKPFEDLAIGLAERGVASIRYDKRTFVYPRQMVKMHDLTVNEETVDDAVFAADLLRKDPRIDPKRVFILGHSMGGMLAPRIDAQGGDFAGFIIMAGTPRRLETVLLEQIDEMLSGSNFLMRWIMNKQAKGIREKAAGLYEMSDEEAMKTPFVGKNVMAYYFKDMGKKTVAEYMAETNKPMFVFQGEGDVQVSAERDYKEYEKILAGRDNVIFKLYPGLNHMMMPAVYADIKKIKKEYSIPAHVDEGLLDDIADWIYGKGVAQ